MNASCSAGDYALVLKSRHAADIGIVVRILFSDRVRSAAAGKQVWDVEAPRGRFFSLAEECLIPLHAYELTPGCRDELFDPWRIFTDGDKQ